MDENTNINQELTGIHKLWELTKGDPAIKIAVLDGPVDLKHASLKNASITSLDASIPQKVLSTHGTFVTSLIFSNHESGIKGIAPNCFGMVKSIYHEETDGKLRSSSQSDIEAGILAAIDNGADIINISGGERLNEGDQIIASLAKVLDKCEEKGILVVAATGNEGEDKIHVPADYPTVLAVGSIQNNGHPSAFSNWSKFSKKNSLVALGEDIIGAAPGNEKAFANGTSFSTALVSGVAGLLASLLKQYGQKKDLLAIRKILLDNVTPCNESEGINCTRIMSGRLNIPKAMYQILTKSTKAKCSCSDKTSPSVSPSNATESSNLLTINNTIMQNETEVTPSEVTPDQVEPSTKSVTPSTPEQTIAVQPSAEVSSPTVPLENTSTSVAPSVSHSNYGVAPSESTNQYNPAMNCGGYPTFKNAELINAIGQPSYDFGTQNNLDTFTSHMKNWYNDLPKDVQDKFTDSPQDHLSMAAFLLYKKGESYPNSFMASQLIWLLNMNATPIYSISPIQSQFSGAIYFILETFLADNVGLNLHEYDLCINRKPGEECQCDPDKIIKKEKEKDDEMRMVLPGYISGKTKLINGNYVESVSPVAYGLANWTVEALVNKLNIQKEDTKTQLISILKRLYVTAWNRGKKPDERALNYSLYNIIELSEIIKEISVNNMQFSNYKVVPSKISRQNSLCREVQLTFFDPKNTTKAATTYSMQIDVSGVTPVIIGETEKWFSPVSVTTV